MFNIILFWTVFTVPAIVIAVLGGAIAGFFLGRLVPPNPLLPKRRTLFGFLVMGAIGLIFFAGQTVEVALGEEGDLWTRLLARAILWVVFVMALSVVGVWTQSRYWSTKK